ncbi:MAG: NADH-quinone oxidoreductase subunit N [Marinoscillum sp.]
MLTDQLHQILGDLGWLSFELVIAGGAMLLLIAGLVIKRIAIIQALFALILLAAMMVTPTNTESIAIFTGSLVIDSIGNILKLLFGFSAIWIVFFPTASRHKSEFYFLILSIVLGSCLMLSANNLLVIYMVIELTSFSSYIITNFDFEKKSFEAGMKYLIFGGVSSALALYGASIIYGYTSTLTISAMDFSLVSEPLLLNVALVLFIGALLFKVSVIPFHIWVPTTYQAAPTDAVAVLTVLPKIGAFVLLHRLLFAVDIFEQYWLYSFLSITGIATIVLGTFGALGQSNVKRMIAYGAIAHSGFLLAAILIPYETGSTAFVWYAVVYALMNVTVFYLISLFEEQGKTEISDFSGLARTESYIGGLVLLIMIALVGLPPTAGFTIKFYLFTAMWEYYQSVNDSFILTYLLVGVLSVVVSLFFYLKIPFQIFLKESQLPNNSRSSVSQRIIATIFTIIVLWLFFSPDLLNNIANNIKFIDW